jgi:hypothetical protein
MRRWWLLLAALVLSGVWAGTIRAQVYGQPYRLTDKEVKQLLNRIGKQSSQFRKELRSALNKSRLNGSAREDNINEFVKQFDREVDRLRDNFNHRRSAGPDVETVLQRALRVGRFMQRYPLTAKAQNSWTLLRNTLDDLARAYNVAWEWDRRYSPDVGPQVYRLSDREVEQLIHQMEEQSGRFRKSLDAALDRSRLDGTAREDEINAFVKSFDQTVKTLHDHFDDHKSTAGDVEAVLNQAAQIDRFMRRNRLEDKARRDWSSLRARLDSLADAYNVNWRW